MTGAYLSLAYASGSGSPWADGNRMTVDVRCGCFSACGTETVDWSASPTASAVADVAAFTSGTQQSAGFAAAGLGAVDKTGLTQVKLRFTAAQTSTAYLFLKSGAEAKLHLTWQ